MRLNFKDFLIKLNVSSAVFDKLYRSRGGLMLLAEVNFFKILKMYFNQKKISPELVMWNGIFFRLR